MKSKKKLIRIIKKIFLTNIKNNTKISKLIDQYLIPQELEKKSNAEVSTPYKLRNKMLDKIPLEFWTKKRKVFEPCSGKGGFIIDIIDRFMIGLKDRYKDKKKRYKIIVEKCLYFCDINPTNIFVCKLLIDPYNEYKINYHEGNTLELDIKEKFNIDGFDAVIGNPPYNAAGNTGTGHTIWQYFTFKSLDEWLLKNGYLCYVHPAGWRKPDNYKINNILLSDLMKKKNWMMYLEIHNTKDGMKIFNCGTRYDWYIIKICDKNNNTEIKDENGIICNLNLKKIKFIPNFKIKQFVKLIGNYERCYKRCFAHSSTKKNLVSKKKDAIYKYKLVHTTPIKEIKYLYTNDNTIGYFGVKKIIFGDSGINHVIIDDSGKYGVTEHALSLKYDNINEAEKIKEFLLSEYFKNFLKAVSWSNYQIDWKIFNHLKKDFWT